MKIIDCSPYPNSTGAMRLRDHAQATLKYGFSWVEEMNAQAKAMERLARTLDNRYTAVRALSVPGLELPIPLVIIGPSGVLAITVTPVRGIYRAKEDAWSVVNSQRRYRPAKPNLLTRATQMARALQEHLRQRGYSGPDVEAVLLGTDPGLHVDAVRPAARVILSDGIDRFADSLRSTYPVLSVEEVRLIAEMLGAERKARIEDLAYDPNEEILPLDPYDETTTKVKRPLLGAPGGMNRGQVTFLIVLAILNVIIIAGFLIITLLS